MSSTKKSISKCNRTELVPFTINESNYGKSITLWGTPEVRTLISE